MFSVTMTGALASSTEMFTAVINMRGETMGQNVNLAHTSKTRRLKDKQLCGLRDTCSAQSESGLLLRDKETSFP